MPMRNNILKTPWFLNSINVLLILFGCSIFWLMSMHHSIVIAINEDPFRQGKLYGYFLVQPQIKVIYGIALLIFVLKEFFIKKPISFKIKTNCIIDVLLPILLVVQISGWYFHLIGS